jgi:hypothetical protein
MGLDKSEIGSAHLSSMNPALICLLGAELRVPVHVLQLPSASVLETMGLALLDGLAMPLA